MKILIYSFFSFLLFLLIILLGAFITGRDKRGYKVLKPYEKVPIGNHSLTVEEMVYKFKPTMFLKKNTLSPPLLWVWYEVVPNLSTYDIVYYYNWENEINPNKKLHFYYSIFRSAYFGYPLYDIEYFQVNVNKKTEKIEKIKFETSEFNKYDQEIVEHIIAELTLNDSLNYKLTLNRKNGEVIFEKEMLPIFSENHILAGVYTWNHTSCLLNDENVQDYLIDSDQNIELKFLSDKDYSKYKFVRKSQGDHKTKENRVSSILALLTVFLLLTVPILLLNSILRKK